MITQSELKETLDYNRLTGIFTYKKIPRNGIKIGDTAGSIDKNGYVIITINHKRYKAHRLAWLYVGGVWPINLIDHKDTVKHHNWIDNLREATNQKNQHNSNLHKDNKTSFKGVSPNKSGYRACIKINNKQVNLGTFKTKEEASQAYNNAAKYYQQEFARTHET